MIENKPDTETGNPILIIGLMSGTSLDGVDLALCSFSSTTRFTIVKASTLAYPPALRKQLENCMILPSEKLIELDNQLGVFYGKLCHAFLKKHKLRAHYIASHGHTVFHQPHKGYTLQIGSGAAMAATAGIPVINDFRSADVALGGQGAPLVPIGDELWFSNFGACINLGGIANISRKQHSVRRAYDITVCNMALNYLAEKAGHAYDKNGKMARAGKPDDVLFKKLNSLAYFKMPYPKSLGKEWFEKSVKPLLKGSTQNLLRTVTEHVAFQLHQSVKGVKGKILVTGGGAHNGLLMERFRAYCPNEIVIPDNTFINFKEAAIFALLGYLRILETPNVLSSVTGASRDHCAGTLHLG